MTAISIDQDCQLLLRRVIDFPDQITQALSSQKAQKNSFVQFKEGNEFTNVVILGMGGSGVVGDIARILTRNVPIPVIICKNSIPPRFVSSSSLVIAITYSGKTKETLSALNGSLNSGASTLVITSSAQLHSSCNEMDIPCILIPENGFPRLSLGFMLVPLIGFLERMGILPASVEGDILEAIEVLNKLRKECSANVPTKNNPALLIADELSHDKFPIIYGESNFTDVVALRWKQELNENSKIHCHYDYFPELLHNEIEAWSEKDHVLILLRDALHEQTIGIKESVDVAKHMIEKSSSRVIELWTQGSSEIARLLSLIYIGDIVSVYLAIIRGVDASAIPNIEFVKQEVGQANNIEISRPQQ